jgi:Ethanolamine utilization protein EutJ (predicted chaperonin)
MQLRRLGVVLTQIATRNNIVKAVFNQETSHVRIFFDEGTLEKDETYNDFINAIDIARRVEDEASADFREAVQYCLEEPFAGGNDVGELESFFLNVVNP